MYRKKDKELASLIFMLFTVFLQTYRTLHNSNGYTVLSNQEGKVLPTDNPGIAICDKLLQLEYPPKKNHTCLY